MKEALDWAAKNGGATGENVAKGFYQKKDWVPAGHGGRLQSLDLDRQGPSRHAQGRSLSLEDLGRRPTAIINDLMAKGTIKLEKVKTVELPRKPEWFGW